MTDRLSRPSTNAEAAESNWAGGHELAPDSISAEDRHAAFCAGLEQGRAERVVSAIEDQIQARLHARTLEALGMAKRSARHGAAFSALVIESGERE
jgi:hypothetical protein